MLIIIIIIMIIIIMIIIIFIFKIKNKNKLKQLVIKRFLFRRFVMVSGILLLTYYKNYDFFS